MTTPSSCTHSSQIDCTTCGLQTKLHCTQDKKRLRTSLLIVFATMIIAIAGIALASIITGLWWITPAYIIYLLVFFLIIETRLTCSHCPFYAAEGKTLRCTENIFSFKLWAYHPEPMNNLEKTGSLIGFILFGLFPLLIESYGLLILIQQNNEPLLLVQSGLLLVTLVSLCVFYLHFILYCCPHCVNFSCLFNRVPQHLIDDYLNKNPRMRDAWQNKGCPRKK